MTTELNIRTNNVDLTLCRLVYGLKRKLEKEELVFLELYNLSVNGFFDTVNNKAVMQVAKLDRIAYSKIIKKLEKRGLVSKDGGMIQLDVNLIKKNINKLTINKYENSKSEITE